jgi:hypothetical protein
MLLLNHLGSGGIMDDKLKNLLLNIDNVENCESPSNFNYINAINKVKSIKSKLEKLLGQKLEVDDCVQDASFFTDLYVLEESQKNKRKTEGSYALLYDFTIRFSSFGNLVTIFSHTISQLEEKFPLNEIIQTLQNNGYTYVNADALDEPYDGVNKYIGQNDTWWIRYFDYL